MDIAIVGGLCKDIFGKKEAFGGITYNVLSAAKISKAYVYAVTRAKKEDLEEWKSIVESDRVKVFGIEDRATTKFKTEYFGEERWQTPLSLSSAINSFDMNAQIVHFNPLFAEQVGLKAIAAARRRARIVSLDAQGFVRKARVGKRMEHKPMENAKEILKNVDLLKLSEIEVEFVLSGLKGRRVRVESMREEIEAIKGIAEYGPEVVELTLGRKGSLVYSKKTGQAIFFPAFATNTVDETGAGDVYATTFAIIYSEERDVEKAGVFATVSSSFCVEGKAYSRIAEREEVLRRVEEYRRRIFVEKIDTEKIDTQNYKKY